MLLVDDEVMTLAIVHEALEEAGYQVVIAESGCEALQILEKQATDILVTNVRLKSGEDGWEIARRARALRPAIPVVHVTGSGGPDCAGQAVGGSQLIRTSLAPGAIVDAVADLLGRRPGGPC